MFFDRRWMPALINRLKPALGALKVWHALTPPPLTHLRSLHRHSMALTTLHSVTCFHLQDKRIELENADGDKMIQNSVKQVKKLQMSLDGLKQELAEEDSDDLAIKEIPTITEITFRCPLAVIFDRHKIGPLEKQHKMSGLLTAGPGLNVLIAPGNVNIDAPPAHWKISHSFILYLVAADDVSVCV